MEKRIAVIGIIVENAEETIKSIQDMGEEHNITVTVNGDSVTIVVDGTKLDDIDGIVDVGNHFDH